MSTSTSVQLLICVMVAVAVAFSSPCHGGDNESHKEGKLSSNVLGGVQAVGRTGVDDDEYKNICCAAICRPVETVVKSENRRSGEGDPICNATDRHALPSRGLAVVRRRQREDRKPFSRAADRLPAVRGRTLGVSQRGNRHQSVALHHEQTLFGVRRPDAAERLHKTANNILPWFRSFGTGNRIQCAKELSKVKLDRTSLGDACASKYNNETACDGVNTKYRSADGSCNNLKHSFWGKANTAYKRLLFPAYKDGII